MNLTIDLQGDKELLAKLKKLETPIAPLRRGMRNYMEIVQKKTTPYPPATSANRRPGRNGYSWYERGLGTRTVTGKLYPTSQDMSKRWSFKVTRMGSGIRATIRNNADYSDFVQGEKQVWYHANRGWKRVDKYIEASGNVAIREISKEVNKELDK